MKKLIQKPHLFFWSLIPILILVSIIFRNTTVSYSYFNLDLKFLCYLTAIFFGLIGFNYFSLLWANKIPKKGLTIAHIILQVLAILFFGFYSYQSENKETAFHEDFLFLTLLCSLLLFITATFIHLINFFLSLLSKK